MGLEGIQNLRVVITATKRDVERKTIAAKKRLGFGIYRRAIFRSPVDSGYFRLCWNLSAGAPNRNTPSKGLESYPPPDVASALAKIANMKLEDDVFVCNAAEYAIYLENGHSKQAPAGVLGLSVLEELEAFRRVA